MPFSRLKLALLAGAAGLVFTTALAQEADQPETPLVLETPPAGQLPDTVRPTAYRVDLVTDPTEDSFEGMVEIDIELDAPHGRIWLHALEQNVESVIARLPDGTEIEGTFTGEQADGGVSKVDFEEPLPTGTATLVFDYTAPYNFGLAGLYKASQNGRDYLATQMEAIDARRMMPSFDEPRFKTPWTMTVTAPAGDEVITNGPETSRTRLEDGMVRHEFATTRPIQSYLIALAVGPYDAVTGDPLAANELRDDPVTFRAFAPAGKGEQLDMAMEITDEMVDWQEAYFDYPYPYAKLDIIAVPDFAYGAMENAGAIIYREAALLSNDRTPLSRKRGIKITHAHELGHQWFGNLVTPKWWDDIWLNEAFATWISYKTMNAVEPDGGYDRSTMQSAIGAMGADSLANARQIRNPIERNADINDAFDSITYRKGGGVLGMFEAYLGEDAFREGMRIHMRRFEDGVADVNDFMESLAEGSGDEQVVESFRSFIFQPGIPYLDVSLNCEGESASLTIEQTRYAPLGSEIDEDAQTWSVPLALRLGDEGELRQMVSEASSEITLEDGCPAYVLPNAGGSGYWRFNLSDEQWSALSENFGELEAAEQLVFTDSALAAYRAGDVSAEQVLDAIEVSATGEYDSVGKPLGSFEGYKKALPDEAREAFINWVEATYRPIYEELDGQDESALSPNEILLRNELHSALLDHGRSEEERADLADRAARYLGVTTAPQKDALDPAQLGTAVRWGAELKDEAFFTTAVDRARQSDVEVERTAILRGLMAGGSPAQVTGLMKTVQGDDFKGQETWSLSLSALANDEARADAWALFKEDFETIIERAPEIRVQQTAAAAGYFCEADAIDEAEAFFEENGDLIPGYERRLAQAVESARLCAAFREQQGEALGEALKAR